MIDLHTHILPGLDDGAETADESLQMVAAAVAAGTTGLVMTPHVIEGAWLPSWEAIQSATFSLQQAAAQEGIQVSLYPGAEVAVNADLLDRLVKPGPYCLNGRCYVLLELPAREIPSFTEDFFFTLQRRGFLPILAHPERHPELERRPELLVKWVERGILLQITAAGLTGKMGSHARNLAESLLISGLVHCLGSDAHSLQGRQPVLQQAARRITELAGEEMARRVLIENPGRLLFGEPVIPPPSPKFTRARDPLRPFRFLNRFPN